MAVWTTKRKVVQPCETKSESAGEGVETPKNREGLLQKEAQVGDGQCSCGKPLRNRGNRGDSLERATRRAQETQGQQCGERKYVVANCRALWPELWGRNESPSPKWRGYGPRDDRVPGQARGCRQGTPEPERQGHTVIRPVRFEIKPK